MGNRYLKDHRHWFDNPHRSMLLPMLCSRPSVKTVALPTPDPFSDDVEPTSPKVGCMGQVKKRNGRVVGFPTPYKLTSHCNKTALGAGAIKANGFSNIVISCSNGGKYSKLRKLFSSKSLLGNAANSPSSTVAATTAVGAASRKRSVCKSGSFGCQVGTLKQVVNIGEMDPPLPVVKKVRKPEEVEEGGSLWRRRFGGVAPDLQTLEIRHNNPKHQLRLVTV